jgi:hypothetical protein
MHSVTNLELSPCHYQWPTFRFVKYVSSQLNAVKLRISLRTVLRGSIRSLNVAFHFLHNMHITAEIT